uniref:Transcription initiation factor IIB n=1 Tax=Arundo donax TaxID=35708 RepID=A0A0A9AYF5_ARUDO
MDDWYTDSDSETRDMHRRTTQDRSVAEVIDLFHNMTIDGREDFIGTQAHAIVDGGDSGSYAADDGFSSSTSYDSNQVGEPIPSTELELEAEVEAQAEAEVGEGVEHLQHHQQRYWPYEDLPELLVDNNDDPQDHNHADVQRLPQAISEIMYEGAVRDGDNLKLSCQTLYMTPAAASAVEIAFTKISQLPVRKSPRIAASTAIYMISLLTDTPQGPEAISLVTGVAAEKIRQYYQVLHPHAGEIIPTEFGDFCLLPGPSDD